MSANVHDLIKVAVEIKQQMNDQMLTLYGRLRDPDAFSRERRDAGKVLERQYAPAIGKIASATTHADLLERRQTLHNRLSKGWTVCSLNPADTDAHDLWEALLVEYTVIEDALNHANITSAIMQRINQIESFVPSLEQGVLV